MTHKLLTFFKPYYFHCSSVKQLAEFKLRRNNFAIRYYTTTQSAMAQKTALFIVAEGSEELELVAPVDILRRANVI